MTQIRASLFLLLLTLGVCGVAYPAVLWAVGRALFPSKANGSLVAVPGRAVAGSSGAAQPFAAAHYFWPRPSAVGHDAAAAGGSNWGANNPKLRDRVARHLGPLVRYRAGSRSAGTGPTPRTPQEDMAAWVAANPGRVPAEDANPAGAFDPWLQDPANKAKVADLEPVPADMVTTSGSGLDPHVTLRNALSPYQLDRVAAARGVPADAVAAVVREKSFTPLAGLAGEPLVNVLEVNLELDRRFPLAARPP